MHETQTEELTPPVSQNDHIEGSADAAVTVVEYGDYQCPYCSQVDPWIKDIREQMGNQVRFVFRNLPLPQHPYAEVAAEAAEAAAAQDKFWPMHDLLYQHQRALEPQHLVQYAEQVGLNVDEFTQALQNHTYRQRVQSDAESAMESGVQGTPTFFINGSQYQGPLAEQPLAEAIQGAANS